jgi:GNAT superfamily N-acetyltransferase
MEKQIINSELSDIETLYTFYDAAIAFQKTVFHKHWLGFERSLVEKEIAENRQFKILIDGEIACIFLITFNDVVIWKEKENNASIYLHRIVTKEKFRGQGLVKDIVEWAKQYCKVHGKAFIRMDTWGDNDKLIDYYIGCGFTFLEIMSLDNTEGLPKHYKGTLSLFEIAL